MLDTSQNVIPGAQITTSQPNFAKRIVRVSSSSRIWHPVNSCFNANIIGQFTALVFAGISAGSASRIPLVFHELFYCHGRLQRSRIGLRRSS